MTGRRRRSFVLVLVILLVAAVPGIYLLDRHDVPSLLIYRARAGIKALKLTLRPIVITDEEVFGAISGSEALPDALKSAAARGDYGRAWALYREARARNATSGMLVDAGGLEDLLGFLRRSLPGELEKVLDAAGGYAADRFTVLGRGPVTLGEDFTWTSFPPGDGDVIYIWEASTLKHLILLAEARLFTGEERYFDAIARHLGSWLEENPIENSINWADPMEVSLRLCSLLWMGEILAGDGRLGEIHPELVRAIYAHARHIAAYIDSPRKKNNHGIFAAAGLYFFSIAYPEFREAPAWKSFSERRLLDELELQYTDRGVQKEFAPAYHLPLLDVYLHYLAVKAKLGEDVPGRTRRRIGDQVRFLRDVTDPGGKIFPVGDSSDQHFLRLAPDEYRDAYPTLYLGALLSGSRETAPGDAGALWEAAWLLGLPLHDSLYAAMAQPLPEGSGGVQIARYLQEGFARIESGDMLLFCDFSRLGAEPQFMGHNHCDIGSFILWRRGAPVVIDPGTYTYRGSVDHDGVHWRDFLRSSRAHNTITVDGRSHAEPVNDFEYRDWPQAKLLAAAAAGDFFVAAGEHGVYEDIAGRAFRIVTGSGSSILVVDLFPESDGSHTYETNIILGADGAVSKGGGIALNGGSILWSAASETAATLLRGSCDPPGGWRSPSYGMLRESDQLRLRRSADGPAASAFLIDLGDESGGDPHGARAVEPHGIPPGNPHGAPTVDRLSERSFAFHVRSKNDSIVVLVNAERDRTALPAAFRDLLTDAFISVFLVQTESRVFVLGGTYFKSPGPEPEIEYVPVVVDR